MAETVTINVKTIATVLSILAILIGAIFFFAEVHAETVQNSKDIAALEALHKEQLAAAQTRIAYLEEKYAEINAQLKVIQAQNEDVKRRLENLEKKMNIP